MALYAGGSGRHWVELTPQDESQSTVLHGTTTIDASAVAVVTDLGLQDARGNTVHWSGNELAAAGLAERAVAPRSQSDAGPDAPAGFTATLEDGRPVVRWTP